MRDRIKDIVDIISRLMKLKIPLFVVIVVIGVLLFLKSTPIQFLNKESSQPTETSTKAIDHKSKIEKVNETRIPYVDAYNLETTVNLPYFDNDNKLRFDETIIHTHPTGDCDSSPTKRSPDGHLPRTTIMIEPRVDQRRCLSSSKTSLTLLGIDQSGKPIWQRPLSSSPGSNVRLIGASRDGLVLGNLEVWLPTNGETLIPAKSHSVGHTRPPVPDYSYFYSAVYNPGQKGFYVFDADVSLGRHEGGLWRVKPDTGLKELIYPVQTTTILGSYYEVAQIALLDDGQHLLLAEQEMYRGPTKVRFVVFNIGKQKIEFEEVFCNRRESYCIEPKVVLGKHGDIGFSYRDSNASTHVIVYYKIRF